MNFFFIPSFFLIIFLVIGCAPRGVNMPLIFGQSHTVGISISSSTTNQGVDLTLGYKDRDIAIVPVTVQQSGGDSTFVKATANETSETNFQDALSVFGQFELNTSGRQVEVGLGKFFATGLAAKKLADGFHKKLGVPQKTELGSSNDSGDEGTQ